LSRPKPTRVAVPIEEEEEEEEEVNRIRKTAINTCRQAVCPQCAECVQ